MKKQIIYVAAMVLLTMMVGQANAKVWRVNNNGFTANFTTLQLANDNGNVQSGDTVHLEGSNLAYAAATINKRLVIIGPGYFLAENPNTSYNILEAKIDKVTFDSTVVGLSARGSQLIGVHVSSSSSGVIVRVNTVAIKRCRIDGYVYISKQISDLKILQNFFAGQSASSSINAIITYASNPTDVIFNNNICQKEMVLDTTYSLLECKNNVFDCLPIANAPSIQMYAGSFQNNILKTSGAIVRINSGTGVNVAYNISASAVNQFGTANNNTVAANITTLFATTGTSDSKYMLNTASADNKPGADGTQRGAFGGLAVSNHYTLSGLAPIPVIYQINTSGVASTSGLTVSIKAKTIK